MMKRKRSFIGNLKAIKKAKVEAESESKSKDESSDTESILSIQNQSTDFANDTEDTSASYASESEIQRNRCQLESILNTSEESEIQEIADLGAAVANAVLENNFDFGLADSSEECSTSPTSNSDIDPGLPRLDFLDFEKCALCRTDKKDISYPYCIKCYKLKKTFFPPRPSRRRKKGSIKVKSASEVTISVSDSVASSQDSGCCSASLGSVEADNETESQLTPKSSTSKSNDNLCEICFEKTRNGLFVHGNSCHLYGCYQCAKKTWVSIKACPLCRKKVKTVLRFLQPEINNQL